MRTPRNIFTVLLLLLWATGCCTSSRPPQPVPRPQVIDTASLDPKALSNRILTSLMISSPLATTGKATIYLQALPEDTQAPDMVETLQLLSKALDSERRFSVVPIEADADFSLRPRIATDTSHVFQLNLTRTGSPQSTWSFSQELAD